jgi:hypothetical protein
MTKILRLFLRSNKRTGWKADRLELIVAKKKLSRDQKRKQKKQRRVKPQQPADPGKRLIRRVRQHGFEQKVVRNPPGQVKMSEVLREFVAPYWHIPDSEEAMRKLITTALVAWNAALLPEAERAENLQEIATALPEETHEDFYAIVAEMIERKDKHFAQYDRTIVDYELVDRGDDYHVSVMSFVPGEEK